MKSKHNRPDGVNFWVGGSAPRRVRWEDEADVRRWFEALWEAVKDLRGAARDRVRRKERRVLSRFEARRQIATANRELFWLLQAAGVGLETLAPRGLAPLDDEEEQEDAPPHSGKRPRTTPSDAAG